MKKTILISILLLIPSLVWCQADGKKASPKATEAAKQDFVQVGNLQGKLEGPVRDGRVRLVLTQPFSEVNADARDESEKLRKHLLELKKQALASPKDSPQRAQKTSELEKGLADLQAMQDRLVTRHQSGDVVELQLQPQTAVRLTSPPGGTFDDKGNVRKYTRADLQKLRGPGNLPGYTGDLDSLRSGRGAMVTVFKKKPLASKEKAPPDPGKNDLFAGIILLADAD